MAGQATLTLGSKRSADQKTMLNKNSDAVHGFWHAMYHRQCRSLFKTAINHPHPPHHLLSTHFALFNAPPIHSYIYIYIYIYVDKSRPSQFPSPWQRRHAVVVWCGTGGTSAATGPSHWVLVAPALQLV